jgi:hypothetical protein
MASLVIMTQRPQIDDAGWLTRLGEKQIAGLSDLISAG